jgi:hypothetical protein
MPSKKSTKVVPACLDPSSPESLGLFSSQRPTRSRRDRRTRSRWRGGRHIRGRFCVPRGPRAAVLRSRLRRGRRAPIHRNLQGKSLRPRCSLAGRWGRSSRARRAPRGGHRSAAPHREHRTGFWAHTRRGRRGSFARAWVQERAGSFGVPELRPLAHRMTDAWSRYARRIGPASRSTSQRRTTPKQR